MTNNEMKIANYYGYESQSRQLVEEMAELTVAINKLWRRKSLGNINNVIEEIADVEIMLHQIKYLMKCEDKVEEVKDRKIKRQLIRIGQGEEAD